MLFMVVPPVPIGRLVFGYLIYTAALCFFNVAVQALISKLLAEKWKDLFFGFLFACYQVGPLLGVVVIGGRVSSLLNSAQLFFVFIPLTLTLIIFSGLKIAG